jgi:S1-C subfamily serine protease
MSTRRRSHLLSAVLPLLCLLVAVPAGAASLPDTIERIKPSIVGVGSVQVTRRPPAKFVGTGFVVGDGWHVMTNAHVVPTDLDVERKEHLAVLVEGGSARKAQLVGMDRNYDLALLRVEGRRLPALELAPERRVREGELYAFTGFPIGMVLGMHPVTHRGIIGSITPVAVPQMSARLLDPKMIRRLQDPYDVYQLDATAYPGNSGSPLYDPETGKVVAVINKVFVKETKERVLQDPSGITYAIPVRYARKLLDKAGL